ncbi:protein FAM81B [Phasianus colchicus]|uniref:Family with sequence similarity 81 member B n=1 Tax=Phasianus colchicus TaxID=9054 RepID=A0A669QJG3_PHACC|nr:protein FAM81B [Phasianus colchicus]
MVATTPGVLAVCRRDPSPAPGPGDKAHLLEGRLSNQERTTAFLLHQAFRIKNDIVSYLQETTGFQHREIAARQLLENYIQTITGIVEKLSQDIQVLERQIRTRDGATVQTNFAIQSLDHKYIQSLGDLRGRVVRCEASIAQLSGDIRVIRHEVQNINKEIYSLHSILKNHTGSFEKMVMQLLGKIETSNSDQSSNLKTVQGDQRHELQLLDFKLTSILNDFKDQIQSQRKWTEAQLTQSEDRTQYQHQLLSAMKERLEAAEKKIEEKLLLLSLQLEQSDNPEKYKRQLNQMKNDEKNLHDRITRFERQIWKELEEIQNEYRSGFQSIHESLELLKQIQNTKLKLEKKKTEKYS